jgi:hypothetical protein
MPEHAEEAIFAGRANDHEGAVPVPRKLGVEHVYGRCVDVGVRVHVESLG